MADMTAITILEELLASIPVSHPERPGIIRAIEVLRTDLGAGETGIVTWDWKAQPDWREMQAALRRAFNGLGCPSISVVPDTEGDEYAVVVSPTPLVPAEAQAAWERWEEEG